MKKQYSWILYLLVLAASYYITPLLISDTGSAMFILLLFIPGATFLTAFIYGHNNGFSLLPTITGSILFIPTIFIYYNASAWIYAFIYGFILLSGTGLGWILHQKKK